MKAPDLVTVPSDFKKYLRFSHMARKILNDYTDRVEPYGIDENWIDVTDSYSLYGDGKTIAELVRNRVKKKYGLLMNKIYPCCLTVRILLTL